MQHGFVKTVRRNQDHNCVILVCAYIVLHSREWGGGVVRGFSRQQTKRWTQPLSFLCSVRRLHALCLLLSVKRPAWDNISLPIGAVSRNFVFSGLAEWEKCIYLLIHYQDVCVFVCACVRARILWVGPKIWGTDFSKLIYCSVVLICLSCCVI